MNYTEFASKIRSKYNAYQDIDDETLAKKFVNKYPAYQSQIEFNNAKPKEQSAFGTVMELANKAVANTPMGVIGNYKENLGKLTGPIGDIAEKQVTQVGYPSIMGKAAGAVVRNSPAIAEMAAFPTPSKMITPLKYIPQKALKPFGKLGSKALELTTNVPSIDIEKLALNPEGMLPGAMNRAKEGYQKAISAAGIESGFESPEMIKRLKNPSKYVFDTYEKVISNKPVSLQDAEYGKQAINAIMPTPNKSNKAYTALLNTAKSKFNEIISKGSPELTEASRKYGIAATGEKFKSLFPRTNTGRPAFVRSAIMTGGGVSLNPASALFSPAVVGSGVALGGTAAKGIGKVLGNKEVNKIALLYLLNAIKANGNR